MSDEQRKEEELEVEAHRRRKDANSEPSDVGEDDEVEAHMIRRASARME
jgi:hypothetical protein